MAFTKSQRRDYRLSGNACYPYWVTPSVCDEDGSTWSSDRQSTAKDDVWALGCLAFDLASATTLQDAKDSKKSCVLQFHANPKLGAKIPRHNSRRELQDFIDMCLKRDIDDQATINPLIVH